MSKTQTPAVTARDPYEEALAFHDATFGRIDWPEGATTVFSFEDKTPVKTVPTEEAEDFAEIADAHNNAHQVWATITPRRAGTVQDGGYKMGKTEDLEDPRIIFIDLDVAKPGYPATIEEALRVAETFALIPHAITCSGGGLQLIFLLSQGLVTTKDKLIIRNLESAFKDHLASYGYKMDAGVTTNLTRPLRVPGSWNRKPFYIQQHGGPLQAYLVTSAPEVPLYSIEDVTAACPEDRAFTERYSDKTMPGTQMAIGLPIGRILSEIHGWTLDGSRWCSNVAGSSTERSGSQYHHDDAGVETVVVWSGTTADEYGVQRGRPYSSFDWLTFVLCGGNYGLATRLAARAVEAGSFDELLTLFRGKEDGQPYTASELADLARKASTAWPEGLQRQHSSALAFRGVAADVASARGYRSIDNLAALPGIWAESLAAHQAAQVTVQGGGMEIGMHGASKALSETKTVRADRSATFHIAGKKGAEPMPHPGRGMAPFMETSWDRGALDANPMVKEAVVEREIPLILVSVGVKYNLGQIHADGIISAARREGLDVAVVSSEFFTSTVVLAGTAGNSTRLNRLGSAWAGIPLREREVYLAGRETWRRAEGLTTLGKALAAKGAVVKVLDFPSTEEKFVADPSVPSIADYLATGHNGGSLKDLMDGALSLDQAVSESVAYDPNIEYEVGKRIAAELDRLDSYRFHTVRQMWLRNEGSCWVPDVAPVPAAFEILHRDGFPLPNGRTVASLMKNFVAADSKLRCDPMGEERDPMELNVLNGVLNLETGVLRDRRHGEVHETVARATFDPEATAPRWQTFLDEIMPDRDTQAYLQEALGVAATSSASAEVIPMLVGSGANGKSILMRTIIDILGPFATSLSSSVIESGLKEYEWATLQSCRLVQIAELPQNLRANTGVLKSLAAPDPIQAAFKYGQPFTYIPYFSTFIMTNFLPTFKEMDDGTWRRLRVVRFNVTIPAERRDKTLLSKLAKERSGILNWILEGAMRFMANGRLTESAAVKADTAAYKLDLDVMGQFFAAGQVHLDAESRVGTKELHQAFQIWMAQEQTSEGNRGWHASTIARKLAEQYGIEKIKSSGDYYYKGLALGPSVEQAAEELKAPDTVAELAPAVAADADADPAVLDLQRRRARAIGNKARAMVEASEKLAATGGW